MTKKSKEGFWKREARIWAGGVKAVGCEIGESFRHAGYEVLTGKPPRKRPKIPDSINYMIVVNKGSKRR